jgi:hypothetical protein
LLVVGVAGVDCYVLDHRRVAGFSYTCSTICGLAVSYPGATVLVGDTANGSAIVNALRRDLPNLIAAVVEDKVNDAAVINVTRKDVPQLVARHPIGSRATRDAVVSSAVEAERVFLLDGALWLDKLVGGRGRGRGRARDALSQALSYLDAALQKPLE